MGQEEGVGPGRVVVVLRGQEAGEALLRGLPLSGQPVGHAGGLLSGHPGQGTGHELPAGTHPEAPGHELEEDEALVRGHAGQRLHDRLPVLLVVPDRQGEDDLGHDPVQRGVVGRVPVGQDQRHRLGQVAHLVVALLHQPRG